MNPDLEVVQIRRGESFKAWEHGYPFHTVRWHFHPEYEIHHVVATTGRYFVGDFIGEFEPGNLVLTGPNLPHNWVSDIACRHLRAVAGPGGAVPEEFIADATNALSRTGGVPAILELSRRGALFSAATAGLPDQCWRNWSRRKACAASNCSSGCRMREPRRRMRSLASSAIHARSLWLHVGRRQQGACLYQQPSDRAVQREGSRGLTGQSPSAFSRSFRRHTGMALVQYVNRLRINLACQLLMSEPEMPITEICFAAGYNNISNFNRQFLTQKGMSPSRFRTLLAENIRAEDAA